MKDYPKGMTHEICVDIANLVRHFYDGVMTERELIIKLREYRHYRLENTHKRKAYPATPPHV